MNKAGYKILFTILMCMMGLNTYAYDIAIENADGVTIYYNYINDGKELEVTYKFSGVDNQKAYSGNIVIPAEVSYMNQVRAVTAIGDLAFRYCSYMTSTTLPNSIESIGESAFNLCTSITSITLPNGVKNIGKAAFYHCYNLESINIPDGMENIGMSAFETCQKLKSINIPNGITIIGRFTFNRCDSLSSVTLPNSVTTIGEAAFRDCNNLKSFTIPDDVTNIGAKAFQGCKSLTSITIPSKVVSIGINAFDNVDIATVISFVKKPFAISGSETDDRTFSKNTFYNATLYIPMGATDKYKNTEGWKDFKVIEEGDWGASSIYKLTYIVDGEEYKSYEIEEGSTITPEPYPTKEGYTFSGWSEIPSTMPANDLTISGSFSINKYKLIYKVDGETYKTYDVAYGASITPETEPTKEGYIFSGWTNIPETMPAYDVTISGSFYKLSGEESKVVGKWKLTGSRNLSPSHSHLEFKSDCTFSYTSTNDASYEEHGIYRIEGETLYQLFSDEDTWAVSKICLLNPISLTLQDYKNDGVTLTNNVYSYQNINPEPSKETYPLIYGKWELTSNNSNVHTHVEFKEDGTFSYTSTNDATYEELGTFRVENYILYQMFSDEDDWCLSKITVLNETSLSVVELKDDAITTSENEDQYTKVASSGINTILRSEGGGKMFTIIGRKISTPTKGINIIIQKDGVVKKVVVK